MKRIVKDFKTYGGKHCITNSMKQIFEYYNYKISEEMLFGLGEGLSFVYINTPKSPMLSGRSRIGDFEKVLEKRLNVKLKIRKPKDYDTGFEKLKREIDKDRPVLIYVDMPYLKYLHLDSECHFGGHAVIVFGYDDEKKVFYVSDRDNDDYGIRIPSGESRSNYHLVSYDEMKLARNSSMRPFPANNKYMEYDLSTFKGITKENLIISINNTVSAMFQNKSHLMGLNGIMKFSKEVLKWDKYDDNKLRISGITNYFQISKDGGTGGGIFRKMYGDFLIESSDIIGDERLKKCGTEYKMEASMWDEAALIMEKLYETTDRKLLKEISNIAEEIHKKEESILTQLNIILNN